MLAQHYIALKVNLNLQYFYLIEIWKSEVQGRNLSKIFGILTSGFGQTERFCSQMSRACGDNFGTCSLVRLKESGQIHLRIGE